MDQEKKEWIEVGLYGIIAICLVYSLLFKHGHQSVNHTEGPPRSAFARGNSGDAGHKVEHSLQIVPGEKSGSMPINMDAPPEAIVNEQAPVLSVDALNANLGDIPVGKEATHIFHITNTGKAPLTLISCDPDEGLFVVNRTRDPIPPGGGGFIEVKVLGNNPPGAFSKILHVNSNTVEGHLHLVVNAKIAK